MENNTVPAPIFTGPNQNASPAPGSVPAVTTTGGVNEAPVNNLVVSAAPAQKEFQTHSTTLDGMLANLNQTPNKTTNTATVGNTNDAYTQMLDRVSSNSDLATKALINSIQSQRTMQRSALDNQYENYKRGLQLLGIQHNEAQSTPELLMGHIQEAESQHQQKLQALDIETNKALIDAQTARDNKDLATLKEKMAYVKDLNQQKQDYLKNIADQMGAEKTIASDQAGQFYDAMQKLSPTDQEAFLTQVAKKYGISLGALTQAMVAEKQNREKAALDLADKQSIINARNQAKAEKPITTAKLNYLKKNNPLVDADLTNTEAEVNSYITAAKGFTKTLNKIVSSDANLIDGKLKPELVRAALQVPEGISRDAVLNLLKPYLDLGGFLRGRSASDIEADYGITKDELDALNAG